MVAPNRIGLLLLAAFFIQGFAPCSAFTFNFFRRKAPAEEVDASKRAPVQFTGAKNFSEDQLRSAIATQLREIQESGLSPARADDTAFYLASFYRKNGYAKAEVDYGIAGGTLILRIHEGPRVLIGKITFVGNHYMPEQKLYDYMIGATPERLAREPAQFPYTEADISAGADRVRGLYNYEGFLNATVDTSGTRISADGTRANIVVRIDEKKQYVFGDIRFEGTTIFSHEELLKGLGEASNGPYSPTKVNSMQRNLQSFFKSHGYYEAQVTVSADHTKLPGGRVPVTFTIVPKGLFRFDGITQQNNTKEKSRLRSSFLPHRFAHLRGQVYDPEKLDETFREMLRTGMFSNLRVVTTPVPGNQLRIDLTYEEAKARELGFNIGFGTYEGYILGINASDRDIFGIGRPLTFSAEMTQRGLRGELLYVDPWVFETDYALRAKLYSVNREELGYSKSAYGARIDLTRKITPHFEVGFYLEEQDGSITSETIDPKELGPTTYLLTTIGLTQTIDFRDNPINPSRGLIFNSAFDFDLLDNQQAFSRTTLRLSYYYPVGKCLIALGVRGGLIIPIIDQIPIDIRFFNGGGTTVRSFAERELGPKDKSGNPLGGEFFTVANAEFIFPIVGGLQGAAFVDAGNIIHDVRTENSQGDSSMRYAIGLGLRYKLPIGPLRLDYGVNPNPKDHEAFGAFHFSFGFAF